MCYYELYIFLGCGHASYSKTPIFRAPKCLSKTESISCAEKAPQRRSNERQSRTSIRLSITKPTTPSSIEFLKSSVKTRERSDSDESNTSSKCSQSSSAESAQSTEVNSGYASNISSVRNSDEITCPEKASHPLYTFRVDALCSICKRQRDCNLAVTEAQILDDHVNRGMIRRKSNAAIITTSIPFQTNKKEFRYQYHSDDTREEALQAQSKDLQPESSSDELPPPAPLPYQPRGRKDRNRSITGHIDPYSRNEKRSIIPLRAGSELTRQLPTIDDGTCATSTSSPSLLPLLVFSSTTNNQPEKPLPPVPLSPQPSITSNESINVTPADTATKLLTPTQPNVNKSNRSSMSSSTSTTTSSSTSTAESTATNTLGLGLSQTLSAEIEAVERTWRRALSSSWGNVKRDVLGRNVMGMDRIMGWQGQQQQDQNGQTQKEGGMITVVMHEKPKAIVGSSPKLS